MSRKKIFIVSLLIVLASFGLVSYELIFSHSLGISGHFSSSQELADYLLSFGVWTVFASIFVMVVQTMFTPLPLFLIAGANGFIFGVVWGIVITMVGAMMGSTIAFYLARLLARDYIIRRLNHHYIKKVDEMSGHRGAKVVFLARLIPVVPSSLISYLAGLSKMSFLGFFLASVFGKLPEIVIYTALGHGLGHVNGITAKVTLVTLLLSLLLFSLSKKSKSA